jgi:hypothetical protein
MVALPRRVVVRWAAVAIAVGALAIVPALISARPAPGRDAESAAAIVNRIRASKGLSYSGYAESDGTLAVPDVAQLGDLPSLLGDVTKMRVWSRVGTGARVDVITDLGETDTYTSSSQPGTLVWDSQQRQVSIVRGAADVRAPRAGDFLPSNLGQRLANGTTGETLTRISSRSIAGRTAQGIRIRPSGNSTIDHVDIWADTKTGVPLGVDITPVGASRSALATSFLSFNPARPATGTVTFRSPADAKVRQVNAADLQGLLGRLRGFPYPSTLAGLAGRQQLSFATHVATYGDAFRTIAVARLAPDDADKFARAIAASATTVTDIPNAQAQEVTTPLVNALLVRDGQRDFVLAGTVPLEALRSAYDQLAAVRFSGRPGQRPAPATTSARAAAA